MGERQTKFTFKYVYPSDLRDLYVNGLWGGITPRGELFVHFYSERHPIPKKAIHELTENGALNPAAEIESGGDAVRMIQTSITMDVNTAIAFRDWLNIQINAINEVKK